MSVERSELYGVIAEFTSPEELLAAARRARAAGYRRLTAYSPFPIDDLPEALGYSEGTGIRPIVLAGGILGALSGYLLQWWTAAVDYPINVGGRPYNSWQAFIPITFELMVLFASLFALVGLLALNGLPMPYHPVFNVPGFDGATRDRFFLCIEARDPRFEPDAARRFLASLRPIEVSDVPA
ncbi:MAG: DUF3341 domain-containing protein [Chloroflexi bacterium]|nr:DUF3341 domain-containing protein [Chloroflexota bacterium]